MAPTYHSILAVDVSGYGARTERAQAAVRAAMRRGVEEAARSSGIPWSECLRQDTGDGLFLLAPAYVPPQILIDPFVGQLDGVLRRHNELSSAEASVRMRVAVHAGLLQQDGDGWVGAAINTTARLLDTQVLRTVLSAADRASTALIISADVHRSVVEQRHVGLDPAAFRPVRVVAKELDTTAWIYVPGYPTPPGLGPAADGPPAAANDSPNRPRPVGLAPPDRGTEPGYPPGSQIIAGNAHVIGGNAGRDITVTGSGGGA
jgi:hypothetical protein